MNKFLNNSTSYFLFIVLVELIIASFAARGGDSPFAKSDEEFMKIRGNSKRTEQPARPDEVSIGPFLETVDGARFVAVRGTDRVVRSLWEGQQLRFGDSFMTGPNAAVRVAFEQGVQVLVAPDSQVTVLEEKGKVGFLGTPILHLEKGEVRALVEQNAIINPMDISDKPYRFFVRTPMAIMGVRGTDFVVASDGEHSEVHTLTGIVDMAHTRQGLKKGNLETVKSGQATRELRGGVMPVRPEPFDMKAFVGALNERQPKFDEMWKSAARDVQSGRLIQKFEKVRKLRTDELNAARFIKTPIKTIPKFRKATLSGGKWKRPTRPPAEKKWHHREQ